ncbi:hypothetical protein JKP88DRAFT_247617 [Tribonema minus]|uniref:Uncharacterized protein n=1 Tax=Tribonema minus TaxID=303371 RepID=A0A836CBP5_9STRA|nr:hypothetical protein JKP88DRAFT_247617 [Tribonema minus]
MHAAGSQGVMGGQDVLAVLRQGQAIQSDMRVAMAGFVAALDATLRTDAVGLVSQQLARLAEVEGAVAARQGMLLTEREAAQRKQSRSNASPNPNPTTLRRSRVCQSGGVRFNVGVCIVSLKSERAQWYMLHHEKQQCTTSPNPNPYALRRSRVCQSGAVRDVQHQPPRRRMLNDCRLVLVYSMNKIVPLALTLTLTLPHFAAAESARAELCASTSAAAAAAATDAERLQERVAAVTADAMEWRQNAETASAGKEALAAEVNFKLRFRTAETASAGKEALAAEVNFNMKFRVSECDRNGLRVSELHAAMAALHAELGVTSREGQAAVEARDKLKRDLARAEARADKAAGALEVAEAKLREGDHQARLAAEALTVARTAAEEQSQRFSAERAAFLAQAERSDGQLHDFKAALSDADAANRLFLKKRFLTSTMCASCVVRGGIRELKALAQKLSQEAADAARDKEARGGEDARALASAHEQLQSIDRQLKEEQGLRRAAEAERDRALRNQEDAVSTAQQQRSELDGLRQAVSRLEAEKHDIVLEAQRQQAAAAAADSAACDEQRLRGESEQRAHAAAEELALAREQLAGLQARDGMLWVLRNFNYTYLSTIMIKFFMNRLPRRAQKANQGVRAKDSSTNYWAGLLSTDVLSNAALLQANQGVRAKDREAAQRLVELSQTNAKLSSELSSLRKHADQLEEEKEAFDQTLQAAAQRVQTLEDDAELAGARQQALNAQLEAARARETKRQALESRHQQVLLAARESQSAVQRQLGVEVERRQREVGEAQRRTKAVGSALEVVQGQLAEEERRSSALRDELQQVKALSAAPGSLEDQAGGLFTPGGSSRHGQGSGTGSSSAAEAERASLQRMLDAATALSADTEKALADSRAETLRSQDRLREVEGTLSEKERELTGALALLDNARNDDDIMLLPPLPPPPYAFFNPNPRCCHELYAMHLPSFTDTNRLRSRRCVVRSRIAQHRYRHSVPQNGLAAAATTLSTGRHTPDPPHIINSSNNGRFDHGNGGPPQQGWTADREFSRSGNVPEPAARSGPDPGDVVRQTAYKLPAATLMAMA